MLTYEQVKDSSVLRYLTRETRKEERTKGLAEGRTKGLAEGRAEGRAEALADVLSIAAKKRFPRLELGDQLQRVSNADALQALLLELFQIKTQKAFLQRLAAAQPTTPKRAKKNGTSKK